MQRPEFPYNPRGPLIQEARRQGFLYVGDVKPQIGVAMVEAWRSVCEEDDWPAIYSVRRGKWWHITCDFIVCKWQLKQPEVVPFLNDLTKDSNVYDQMLERMPTGVLSGIGYGQDIFHLGYLSAAEARAVMNQLVYRLNLRRPTPGLDIVFLSELGKTQETAKGMVKFFKDGKSLAVQTDATDEAQFTRDFSTALQDFMTSPQFEGGHEVETLLKAYAELCCKMRGYKADVREQRMLTVGEINPADETLITASAHGARLELLPPVAQAAA